MAKTFSATVAGINNMTINDMRRVASDAIQDVMEAAQTSATGISKGGTLQVGKIPVAEAELIDSLSTNGGTPSADSYVVAIAGFEIGNTDSFAWTAPHAMIKEVGNADMAGWHFVGTAARKFPEFVEKHVKEVRK